MTNSVSTSSLDDIIDFESFYKLKVQPVMDTLKAQAKEVIIWFIIGIGAGLLVIASFFVVIATTIGGFGWLIFLFLIFLCFCIYWYSKKKDVFVRAYKATIIKEVVKCIDPSLVYEPENYIHSKEYKASGLYRTHYDTYSGNDLIKGTYNGVSFHCSELETSYEAQSGNRGTYEVAIFEGLFFSAAINCAYHTGTYVWTRGVEELPSSMADRAFRLMPLPKVADVRFDDPTFEKQFRVCSTDSAEARAILSPVMRDHMIQIKTRLRQNIVFSFVGGRCYVGIPLDRELLEPSVYKPDDKEDIKGYFLTIMLVLGLIKNLELTRMV